MFFLLSLFYFVSVYVYLCVLSFSVEPIDELLCLRARKLANDEQIAQQRRQTTTTTSLRRFLFKHPDQLSSSTQPGKSWLIILATIDECADPSEPSVIAGVCYCYARLP